MTELIGKETGVQRRQSVAAQVMAMVIFPVDDEGLKDAAVQGREGLGALV